MRVGLIREIKLKEPKIEAGVVRDSDAGKLLVLLIYRQNGEVLEVSFNVDWLESSDPERTDWLAFVVGRNLRDAYNTGYNDQGKKVRYAIETLLTIGKETKNAPFNISC